MRDLRVLLNGEPVGTLQETRKGARFLYDADVVAQLQGRILLSASLPIKSRAYGEGLTGAWFEGLLPEGERLDRISRELGCSPYDYVGLLSKIGWECAGAVSVVDPACDYPEPTEPLALSTESLAERLTALPSYECADMLTARISLGGFQEKLCVVADGVEEKGGRLLRGAFALPDAATVSTHILKPQPLQKYAHLIQAEAWAMRAASFAARCAKTQLLDLDNAPLTLVVERFDRSASEGRIQRIHQEDCCQALGLSPARKYATVAAPRGDDPAYGSIAGLLMSYAAHPDEELAELFRQMTVNLALGNTDAHAKNYALLYKSRFLPTVSPMYDVVPVLDIEPEARFLSMRIGGELAAKAVTRKHLVEEALSWGMGNQEVESLLSDTLDALRRGIDAASELYPEAASLHAHHALERISRLGG